MKFIAQGGLTSKNVPPNSRDSILLTMYSNLASGIALNVFYTSDFEIVIANYNQVNLISKGDNDFSNTEAKKVLTYDIGSKVKSHYLMTLEEALSIYKRSTKIMVLKIDGILLEDTTFRNKLINLLADYPTVNTYILSNNKEKLKELFTNASIKSRIGINIKKENASDINIELDFYALDLNVVTNKIVNEKLTDNKDIFVDMVNTQEKVDYLNSILDNKSSKFIYIISDNIGPVLSNNLLTTYTT